MSPRTWIAAVAVVASTTSVRFAYADGKNEIRAVTFDEAGGTGATNVHVRGADAPTFTAYKLERPARVVIDMPQARLADVLKGHESAATFTPNTWAVSTIAAQPMDDSGVRVIVTLARPGRYDVKNVGNEIVVMVSPRDPAPKNASPEELVRAQQQAAAATAAATQSRADADAAKAEAERLRKAAADQLARAEAAQRAVDQAKHASSADLDAAKAVAIKAKQDADAAKAAAATAQLEAERTRKAADKAKQDALAEAASAKADAARAHDDAHRAQAEAATAKAEADQWKTDAARTKTAADKRTADAEAALARAQAEAVAAKQDAAKQRAVAEQARRDAEKTNAEAASAKSAEAKRAAELAALKSEAAARAAEAASAKSEAAKRTAEAEAAKTDAAKRAAEAEAARSDAAKRTAELDAVKSDAAKRAAELDAVMREANSAKTASQQQLSAARTEAANAKAEAARARSEAEAARLEAAADKKKAEVARGDAEKMLKDAKLQLASLDQKIVAAQSLDDKARAANAAAQAREEAAREVEAKAKQDRAAAELAAKQAQDAQTKVAASQRTKAAADAKAAEDRLAEARRATAAAEQQRRAAETAAQAAKQELEQSRTALASVEQQRTEATSLASVAARKRSDAEAAASDAARRRGEAEAAAADAAKQKKLAELAASDAMQKKSQAERDRADAEAQRIAALDAAKSAQAARDAAEKQRKIAEKAADAAVAAKSSAESSLAALTAKRQAAERAAAELETRAQAEAKAQAQIAAAQTRKASDDEVARAKAELAKLASERKQAEGELADRRKAVALQQAEATRLETAATQAHDAANREETRRAELAKKRTAEETALVAAKAEAQQIKAEMAAKPVKVADAKPTKVTAIDFKGDEAAGQVTIAVGDGANVQIGEITASHAELIVDNAELAQKLERKLDVSKLGSPVRAVSSFRDRRSPNRVRLVAELSSPATPTVDREGGTVRWHFTSVEAVAKRPVKVTNVPSPVVGGFGAASTPVAQQTVTQLPPQGQRRRIYHGATIDLDIRDAPIHDLLRLLADTGHVSIVVPDTVTPKVTIKLKKVPWDQALEVILQANGLWYRRDGNIYRIATRKELDTEDQEEAARREAALKAEAPRVERLGLNYASAAELKPRLESMLSPHGRIEVDDRTNALLVNDVAANRAEIIRLALELDTQTPQISIEARIVEARSTFLRQIGVQWGGNAIAGAGGGNATGLIWPSSIAVTGANTDQQTISTGVAAPSDFAVNLPAATGAGEGGALGFSLGSIGGNFNINLRLSALEDTGTVRIISAPKITVLNNKEATISQGVSIPISVVSAAGTNTQFVQADLKLQVTPYVSQRDCAIAMNLVVQKNEPDFVNVGARGDPTILRKEAKTQMLVADGETTVLGGIYTRNAGVAYKKIPLFGDIPVLGWLFKNRRENDDRTEILVFITPKITNKGSLPCVK